MLFEESTYTPFKYIDGKEISHIFVLFATHKYMYFQKL